LDVLSKRPDGYHDLKMIMQTIYLSDTVTLQVIDKGIEVYCSNPNIPVGEGNIAYKAAEIMIQKYNINRGIRIDIDKQIPVAAGLAGGSSNAAAVIKGINELFSLGLSDSELLALGKQIGADVPYCIKGGTMLAEGIGEVLTELDMLQGINILLVKPKIDISTAWVYKNLDLEKKAERPNTDFLIDCIKERRIDKLAANMKNVLETVSIKEYRIIEYIKNRMIEFGAQGSMMSGSGPSVFGIFKDRQSVENAYNKMKDERWDSFITFTC
ncbi:MAG TPA: 4-(cytidine 5'-diphospho)-2-C-methyl-D-erythritol kinase, partial [Clostridia bacterium]